MQSAIKSNKNDMICNNMIWYHITSEHSISHISFHMPCPVLCCHIMLLHHIVLYCIVLYCIISSRVASLRFTSRSSLVRRVMSHPSHLISIHPILFHYFMSYVALRSVASRHVISYFIGYEFFFFFLVFYCPINMDTNNTQNNFVVLSNISSSYMIFQQHLQLPSNL